jgi:hypothetical protein
MIEIKMDDLWNTVSIYSLHSCLCAAESSFS